MTSLPSGVRVEEILDLWLATLLGEGHSKIKPKGGRDSLVGNLSKRRTLLQYKTSVLFQYRDLERAMIGRGNYNLAPNFIQFKFSAAVYATKIASERQKIFNKFLQHQLRPTNSVTSTDGLLTVPKTPSIGKKQHQIKRKRTAKTTTTTKKMLKM